MTISKSVIYTIDFNGVKLSGTKSDLLSLRSHIDSSFGVGGNKNENLIIVTVCHFFGIKFKVLCGGPRSERICQIRFMTYQLLKESGCSNRHICELLPRNGKPRDYGTIISGITRHKWLMKTDANYAETFEKLKQQARN